MTLRISGLFLSIRSAEKPYGMRLVFVRERGRLHSSLAWVWALSLLVRPAAAARLDACVVQSLESDLRARMQREAAPGVPGNLYSPEVVEARDLEYRRALAQRELAATARYASIHERRAQQRFQEIRHSLRKAGVPNVQIDETRNLAVATLELAGGEKRELIAFSGPSPIRGTAPPVDTTKLRLPVARDRIHDSEAKIFESLSASLSPDARGTLLLYSERIPCPSCSFLIREFQRRHPGIRVEVPRLSSKWGTSLH